MAPRSIKDIFDILKFDINTFEDNYLKNIDEICSHPKDVLILNMNLLSENLIRTLRERLFAE